MMYRITARHSFHKKLPSFSIPVRKLMIAISDHADKFREIPVKSTHLFIKEYHYSRLFIGHRIENQIDTMSADIMSTPNDPTLHGVSKLRGAYDTKTVRHALLGYFPQYLFLAGIRCRNGNFQFRVHIRLLVVRALGHTT